jgi:TetR/AcrR family transcriptional regulator, repressor for uid operon
MTQTPTTAEAILAAAKRAIRARGPEKLTLSAVASEAGVSRPTLYRWFPTKTLLLGALAAYEVERFDRGLQAAVDASRDPTRQLDAALQHLVMFLADSTGPDALRADPAFALQSIADSHAPHVESFARVVGDALNEVPAVRAGALTRPEAAEMFLRLAYSHYVVPHPDPERLLTIMRAFAGIAGPRAQRAAR